MKAPVSDGECSCHGRLGARSSLLWLELPVWPNETESSSCPAVGGSDVRCCLCAAVSLSRPARSHRAPGARLRHASTACEPHWSGELLDPGAFVVLSSDQD